MVYVSHSDILDYSTTSVLTLERKESQKVKLESGVWQPIEPYRVATVIN